MLFFMASGNFVCLKIDAWSEAIKKIFILGSICEQVKDFAIITRHQSEREKPHASWIN